jgi:putrescine transport system substrate-binding protein
MCCRRPIALKRPAAPTRSPTSFPTKDSKNVDEAHAFINYLLRPEVIAKISDYVAYANPNSKATALVDEDVRNNPGVYPSAEVMAKLYVAEERPRDVQRWLTRDWTRIKSGR